ncbi:hypothetical protein D3C80_1853530 [compost metagenome]
MHALNLAALSAFRLKMLLVAEIHQRTQAFIHLKDQVSAVTAVSASWTTLLYILLAAKRYDTIASIAALYKNFRFIDKHAMPPFTRAFPL